MGQLRSFVNYQHKTMSELLSTAAHINREDKTSQKRVLPHVPKGYQIILDNLAREWFLRGETKVDVPALCNSVINDTDAAYPRRRKGGAEPLVATHFLFQLDKRELENNNPNPQPVLSRIDLEEEYNTKGHQLAWEPLFGKMNRREIEKLIHDEDSAYYKGLEGFVSQSYDTAKQEWFGAWARDFKNNKVLYERYQDCFQIIREIYPIEIFHPKSRFMDWIDLDERGHLKIEFLVCPIVKNEKTEKCSVSVSKAFLMLTEKQGLPYFQTKRALLQLTAKHLAKRGYVYEEREPYYGRSAKQDIEAIAAIKIEKSAVKAELEVALQDLKHLKAGEDLKILKKASELCVQLEKENTYLQTNIVWKGLKTSIEKSLQRANERDHLIKNHEVLKSRKDNDNKPSGPGF